MTRSYGVTVKHAWRVRSITTKRDQPHIMRHPHLHLHPEKMHPQHQPHHPQCLQTMSSPSYLHLRGQLLIMSSRRMLHLVMMMPNRRALPDSKWCCRQYPGWRASQSSLSGELPSPAMIGWWYDPLLHILSLASWAMYWQWHHPKQTPLMDVSIMSVPANYHLSIEWCGTVITERHY